MARMTHSDEPYGPAARGPSRRGPRWSRWAIGIVGINLAIAAFSFSGYDNGAIGSVARMARDRFDQTRATVRNRGLAQQIEARIRQEKTIEADRIEVAVEDENTAILTGLVADSGDKEKAVALTRDTRGVLRVVDKLAVIPASRVIDAPPDSAPAEKSGDVAQLPRIAR